MVIHVAAGEQAVVVIELLVTKPRRAHSVPGGCERTLLSRFLLHLHGKTRRELLQERGLGGCGPVRPDRDHERPGSIPREGKRVNISACTTCNDSAHACDNGYPNVRAQSTTTWTPVMCGLM